MKETRVYDQQEAVKVFLEKRTRRPGRVEFKIEDEYAIFVINGFDYDIALERIRSPKTLLGWVLHLEEKNWITKELLAQFICSVCKEKGWGYPATSD